jgi:hypothetical protein
VGKDFASQSKRVCTPVGYNSKRIKRADSLYAFIKLTLTAELRIRWEERGSRMTK